MQPNNIVGKSNSRKYCVVQYSPSRIEESLNDNILSLNINIIRLLSFISVQVISILVVVLVKTEFGAELNQSINRL